MNWTYIDNTPLFKVWLEFTKAILFISLTISPMIVIIIERII